jgi:hypothetical protein
MVLDAVVALRPVTFSAEQISGVLVVHVTTPPPEDGVASNDGPMAKMGYDAAAPVMLSVRVRGTVVVVVVVVGGATVVVGAGAGGAVVVVVVVGDATVTTTVCGEPTRVVWALPTVSVMENPAAAVRVELTGTSSARAVDVAVIVHTVPEV